MLSSNWGDKPLIDVVSTGGGAIRKKNCGERSHSKVLLVATKQIILYYLSVIFADNITLR